MIGWEPVISGLLTLNLFALGAVYRRLGKMDDRIDGKVGLDTCGKQQTHCHEEFREIWDAVKTHSHTGLPVDSRVTR